MQSNSIKDDETTVQPRAGEARPARWQFVAYKLFLVIAAYAVSFAAFGSLKHWGIFIALWVGTAIFAWILAVRTGTDFIRSLLATAGALIGGSTCMPIAGNGSETEARDTLARLILGAVVGAFLFAGVGRIVRFTWYRR